MLLQTKRSSSEARGKGSSRVTSPQGKPCLYGHRGSPSDWNVSLTPRPLYKRAAEGSGCITGTSSQRWANFSVLNLSRPTLPLHTIRGTAAFTPESTGVGGWGSSNSDLKPLVVSECHFPSCKPVWFSGLREAQAVWVPDSDRGV